SHPARGGGRLDLEQQPRLADPSLRHRGSDLPTPSLGLLGGILERLHLALPPDAPCEPVARRALQPGAQRSEAGDLVNVDRLAHAFDFGRTKTVEKEVAHRAS